jgi:hypothetical protein
VDFQPSKLEKVFPDKSTLTYFYIPYIPRSRQSATYFPMLTLGEFKMMMVFVNTSQTQL